MNFRNPEKFIEKGNSEVVASTVIVVTCCKVVARVVFAVNCRICC